MLLTIKGDITLTQEDVTPLHEFCRALDEGGSRYSNWECAKASEVFNGLATVLEKAIVERRPGKTVHLTDELVAHLIWGGANGLRKEQKSCAGEIMIQSVILQGLGWNVACYVDNLKSKTVAIVSRPGEVTRFSASRAKGSSLPRGVS